MGRRKEEIRRSTRRICSSRACSRARWTSRRGSSTSCIERGTGRPRRPEESRPRTTLAKQLALYVVLYSPLQMAADLPENYEKKPAFQFIRDVAVDWDTTRVIDGKIGDYVIVARKARSAPEWFIGAITDEEARTFDVPLSFLPKGSQVRGGDLRGRTERELGDQPAAGDDLEATRDVRDATACRAGPRRRPGDPDSAGAVRSVIPMKSWLPGASVS